jgi:hypothetical protein
VAISFISAAATAIFVFYIAAKHDYVDAPHSEDRVIRSMGLSGAGL